MVRPDPLIKINAVKRVSLTQTLLETRMGTEGGIARRNTDSFYISRTGLKVQNINFTFSSDFRLFFGRLTTRREILVGPADINCQQHQRRRSGRNNDKISVGRSIAASHVNIGRVGTAAVA